MCSMAVDRQEKSLNKCLEACSMGVEHMLACLQIEDLSVGGRNFLGNKYKNYKNFDK